MCRKVSIILFSAFIFYGCDNFDMSRFSEEKTSFMGSSASSSVVSVFTPTYLIEQRFESGTGNYWVSKGSNVTVSLASIGGQNAVRIQGISIEEFTVAGIELQWYLVGPSDLSKTNFVISFDLYIPSGNNINRVIWSFYNQNWEGIISKLIFPSSTNQWKNYSFDVSPENIDFNFVSGGFEACTNMHAIRIQFMTQNPLTYVEIYLDNLIVTNKF